MRAKPLLAVMTLLLSVSAAVGVPATAQEIGREFPAATIALEPVVSDVSYGKIAVQKLDIYPQQTAQSAAPMVVVLQNSAWVKGDKSGSGIVQVATSLQEAGFVVFSIDIRLATPQRDGVPMQTADIELAVKWVSANGSRYGGESNNISLLGGSGGAQLLALAGQLINARPGQADLVDGVIEMSGVMDFVMFFQPSQGPRPPDGQFPNTETYLGCQPSTCTVQQLKQASPAWQVKPTCPAYLLINATAELTPTSQPEFMQKRLLTAGCTSRLRLVPGSQHGLTLFIQTQGDVIAFVNSL